MPNNKMTKSGKASDQSLTEEAYARSTGAATIPNPGPAPREPPAFATDWTWCLFYDNYRPWEAAYDRYSKYMEGYLKWRKEQRHKNAAGNNQHQLGPREFTLTYSDKHFDNDEDAQSAMRSALEKLTRYYRDEIIEFHAVGEFTRAGRSHVHGWYNLVGGRKITDKNFKRAYPIWNPKRKLGKGFEGGHHATISRVSDFAGYTEKHLEEAWIKVDINNADEIQEVNVPQADEASDYSSQNSP